MIEGQHCDTCDDPACRGFTQGALRDCSCPVPNTDCQHPTCPRFPQPGHLTDIQWRWVEQVAWEWHDEAQRAGCKWHELSVGILLAIAARRPVGS